MGIAEEPMINKIYINEVLIIDEISIDKRQKAFLLENGEKHIGVNKAIENLKIECVECLKRKPIKMVNRTGHRFKKYRCFSCNSAGENNPFYGKKHDNALKERFSTERSGTWGVGENNAMHKKTNFDIWNKKYGRAIAKEKEKSRRGKLSAASSGENNPFYGKKHSEEVLKIIKEKSKKSHKNRSRQQKIATSKNISNSQKRLQKSNPEKYSEQKARGGRESFLSQSRNYKMNIPETIIFNKLKEYGLHDFEYSVILGFHQFDFGNKKHKTLIEVHGDYWHCNPKLYRKPKNLTQIKNTERDKIKAAFAKKHGMKLYVIWEKDTKEENFYVLEQIKKHIDEKT